MLESAPTGIATAIFYSRWNIKDYWIFYTPVEGDGARITDFRLIALPTEAATGNPTFFGDPIMSDGSGIVFAYNQWSYREAADNIFSAPRSSDFGLARVACLEGKVRAFAQAHPPGVAPSSLKDALDEETLRTFQIIEPLEKSETASEGTNPYIVRYFPAQPDDATHGFSISVTCADYGKMCIRSYFWTATAPSVPHPSHAQPLPMTRRWIHASSANAAMTRSGHS